MEELIEKRIKKYKRISIVGIVVFLAIILFQIGYYIFWNDSCSTPSYINTIYAQEIDAFNSQFDSYVGKQPGSNVKSLLSKLITNAKMNRENISMIPGIIYEDAESLDSVYFQDKGNTSAEKSYALKNYQNWITNIRAKIDSKGIYNIEFGYSEFDRLVNLIRITKVQDV